MLFIIIVSIKVQGIVRRYNARIYANRIERVEERIKNNRYSPNLEEDDLFFFSNNRLGDGSDKDHTHIMMTSKAMMSKCENKGVFHIDGTYKLIQNRFPVMVFGITDIAGEFHPIAYCITSHEKEEDFVEFFTSLQKLAKEMHIDFSPDYLMIDASDATYNAVVKLFPGVTILMCYFHMMQNVIKNCRTMVITEDEFEKFKLKLYYLHMSKTNSEFVERVSEFKIAYNHKITKKAYDYMMTQWIDNARFSKWQIFHSPPGYANTNSNIESFNRQIKGFTQKKKLSIFGMLDKCCEMVHYYSTSQKDKFNEYPRFLEKLNNHALKIDQSLFKKITSNKFSYTKWVINRTEKSCSCRGFLKHAICPHSLAFSHMKDLNWFGPKYQKRSNEFVYKNKKGSKKGSRYKKARSALEMDDD